MTVKELARLFNQEKYDVKGAPVYIRKYGVGCWKIDSVSNEDSGIYIEAGDETNPQNVVESKLEVE